MNRLAISVEGRTEEEFVKLVLADHLRGAGVEATPILIGRRGGAVSVDRLAPEMAQLSWHFDYVTSLVDLYGFRRRDGATAEELEQRINDRVADSIGPESAGRRVFAYVQRHEFEALLFSDVSAFGSLGYAPPGTASALRGIRAAFATPEDIDDGPGTNPAGRIRSVIPRYEKPVDGPLLADAIGLEAMREECPGFGAWVARLETLGA